MRYKSIRRYKYKPVEWAVLREREQIAETKPPQERPEVMEAGLILDKVVKELGLASEHWLTRLADEWPQLAGDVVSKHTRPGRLDGKTLVVFVDNSVWLSELSRFGKEQLLANIKKQAGRRIKDLRLQLDPDSC